MEMTRGSSDQDDLHNRTDCVFSENLRKLESLFITTPYIIKVYKSDRRNVPHILKFDSG